MRIKANTFLKFSFLLASLTYATAPWAFHHIDQKIMAENERTHPQLSQLPIPYQLYSQLKKTQIMSIKEAVLLGLRYNPTVRNKELDRITEKYALAIARNEFQPRYALKSAANLGRQADSTYSITPSVSLKTPFGTQIGVEAVNSFEGTGSQSSVANLSITQPLIRGFGPDVVLIDWHNQLDQEAINKLNLKNQIMSVATDVAKRYYETLKNYNEIKIRQRFIQKVSKELEQTRLKYKLGEIPESDLIRQRGEFASQQIFYEESQQNVKDALQNLFQLIGLDSNAKLDINQQTSIQLRKPPDLQESIKKALSNNPDYLSALISLRTFERAVTKAKNNKLWDLSLTASLGQSLGTRAGLAGTKTRTLAFSLDVPIDDLNLDSALVSAKINLQKAKYSLRQRKQELIANVVNSARGLKSALVQIKLSEQNVQLRRKVFEDSLLSFRYGKVTSFQVASDENAWRDSELRLINEKIAYVQLWLDFDRLLGVTLERWGIEVEY